MISTKGREKRLAVYKNQELEQLHVFQPGQSSLVGNIYYGIVTKVEAGMNACFVQIGTEKNGYLHRDQFPNHQHQPIQKLVHQGQKIIVQVKKDGTGSKGPRLTAIIEWSGELLIYMPKGRYVATSKKVSNQEKREKWKRWGEKNKREEEGVLLRTAAFSKTKEMILNEWNALRNKQEQLEKQTQHVKAPKLLYEKNDFFEEIILQLHHLESGVLVTDDRTLVQKLSEEEKVDFSLWTIDYHYSSSDLSFDHQLDIEIEKALKTIVWLPSGGFIVIEPTEAMTVIDVNTGKFTGKTLQEETIVQTNLQAAKELTRQMQLRDLSGMIIVDFIDMKNEEHRKKVKQVVEQQIKKDVKHAKVHEMTSLGLLQITRKKTKKSLTETITSPCPACLGKGRVKSAETIAFQLERKILEFALDDHEAILLEMTEDVHDIFVGEQSRDLSHLETLIKKTLFYRTSQSAIPYGEILRFGTKNELKEIGKRL